MCKLVCKSLAITCPEIGDKNNVESKRSCLNFDMLEIKDVLFEVKKILKKNISQVRLKDIYKNNIRKYWYIYKKQVNYTYCTLPSAYIIHAKFHIACIKQTEVSLPC